MYCTYCGEPADTLDHVIPRSAVSIAKRKGGSDPGEKVPCCHECNVLLGSLYVLTVPARARTIYKKLKTRYAKLLKAPEMTPEELAEYGPSLRRALEQSVIAKKTVLRRLEFAKGAH